MTAPRPAPSDAEIVTNKRHPREQEGFQRTLGPESAERHEALRCGTAFFGVTGTGSADSRGWFGVPASRDRRHIEWETSKAESAEATVFTWMGGSRVWPAMAPAYPYLTAALSVDGGRPLRFPIGIPEGFRIVGDDFTLEFEPRQFKSLVESHHRFFEPSGVTGFYRLHAEGRLLAAGRALRMRIEFDQALGNTEASLHVVPRTDCLSVSLRILRDEVVQLQTDMVAVTRSLEVLYAQVYPQLFPQRLRGERGIVTQDSVKHLHPATLTVMSDGEVVVAMREATDHLARDGRIVLCRSRDGGRTWSDRQVMFPSDGTDHRSTAILELPNGDWLATDYRAGGPGGVYKDDDTYPRDGVGPSQWAAWSVDRGRSWTFCAEPLVVPGETSQFCEIERHMIRLPGGRLLVGAAHYTSGSKFWGSSVFASDDNGRSWSFLSKLAADSRSEPESTMLRTRSGKILMLVRTVSGANFSTERRRHDWTTSGGLLQAESLDDGRTWSAYRETGMSSMNTPGHLLQLQDGRILCAHASRAYPGSIHVTTSSDEGATWDTARTRMLANDQQNFDFSYPTSGQLQDGTIITVWYGNLFGKFFIASLRYAPGDL